MADQSSRALQWAQMTAARHGVLLAYLIPTLLSAIAVQTWFEPGTVVATSDLAPPVQPAADYISHWSHLTGGEGAPTFDVVVLPYAAWIDVWGWFGVGEEIAQRLWLTALFAGAAAAVVFLAFGFTTNPLAAGAAGVFASFNAYRLITVPDSVPMTAILVAALLGGLVLRAARPYGRGPSVLAFAFASLGLGYVMTNPPHVMIVILWVAACATIAVLMRPQSAGRVLGYVARATPLALLFNLWWIVPALLTVSAQSFDDRFTAASVDDWTWTHERATIANALTLNTHWGWDYAEYFPYASRLSESPYEIFALALPLLAIAGVVLGWASHRRLVLGLSVTALAAVWLTTGLNGPIPEVNGWLYDHVPGYWLFREPSKLLLLVALPAAILAGFGLSRLVSSGSSTRQRALGVGLAAGALLYVHPLFTGDVVPDDRPLLPSAHVQVPQAWENVSATLNEKPAGGKVLVLPRSDFYQVPTTWGYYGVTFTPSIIARPVLEAKPGGYFEPPQAVASLFESIENDLAQGRTAGIRGRLSALGIRYVLLRRDVATEFPDRRIVSPALLAPSLRKTPGIRRIAVHGPLELYAVRSRSANEVFAATPVLYAGTDDAVAPAIGTLPGTPAFVADRDDQQSITEAGVRPARVVRIEHEIARRIAVKRQGRSVRVRLADPFRLTAGGRPVAGSASSTVAVRTTGGAPVIVTAGNSLMPVRQAPRKWANLGLVGLQPGESVSVWRRSSVRGIDLAGGGPVKDCNELDDRSIREVGLRRALVGRGSRRVLRLSARAHSACVRFTLARGRSGDLFRVAFGYRQRSGRPARACIWLSGEDRCASAPELRPGKRWKSFSAPIRLPRGTNAVLLFLYADGSGRPPATVAEYRRIRFERYGRAGSIAANPRVRVLPANPKTRLLAFARAPLPPEVELAELGPVGDCQRFDARTATQLGLDARIVQGGQSRIVRLSARAHSACVNFPITAIEEGARAYRVRFEYRSVSGNRARVCLWQVGPERCATLPDLRRGNQWRTVDETLALDADVRALRLYLYADGGGGLETVTEYSNVRIGPVGSVALVGIPRERPLPQITARRVSPSKFVVRVENARGPFMLATGESYAPGWKATAAGEGHPDSALRHVEVNGYANGWLVPWKGSYTMTLEYGPERYAQLARVLSVGSLLAVLGLIGLRRVRAFDQRWHAR
jgi:arabinofuranan 3-O-arabinosyltransferase